jgi:hypothetical protein
LIKTKFKTNYFPNKTEKFINNKKSSTIEYYSIMNKSNSFIYETNLYNKDNKIQNRTIQNIINERRLFKIIGILIKRYKK